jgi:AAA15 family ATPase/GTPase
MDEFDASLHPLLAEEVRNLINDPDTNPNGAQFVLVTHNDSLLDSMQLRRDQIIMVTRGRSRGTEWYSLAELDRKPKPDESFQKRYLKGGYGGVPRVGDLRAIFLDIMREKVGS